MTDYARGGILFGMIADGLAAALNMTECAVCLYEAACRPPGGQRAADSHVPERLEPTTGRGTYSARKSGTVARAASCI
jgi:hypothetical protein